MNSLRFTLSSFPPTTNHLYFQRGRHRVLTDVARAWKASAQAEVTEPVMSTPGYPEACMDAVFMGLARDDSYTWSLTLTKGIDDHEWVEIYIEEAA
jgi:hypothetical protein